MTERRIGRGRPWEELEEDVDWLVATGTPREEICRRLGVSVESVQRAYVRHGRPVPPPFRVAPRLRAAS